MLREFDRIPLQTGDYYEKKIPGSPFRIRQLRKLFKSHQGIEIKGTQLQNTTKSVEFSSGGFFFCLLMGIGKEKKCRHSFVKRRNPTLPYFKTLVFKAK